MSEKPPIRLNRALIGPGVVFERQMSVLVPVRAKDNEALERYPLATWLNGRVTRPRNPKTHRTYFKVIALAATMWPEGHEPEPDGDENHLRAWLQCKAGRCHWYDFRVDDIDTVSALIRDVRGDGKFAFLKCVPVRPHRGAEPVDKLRVYIPDTIEYEALDEDQFKPIKDKVFEIIEQVLGTTVKELLEHADAT